MLAGRIRLKTFMIGVGVLLGVGGGLASVLFATTLSSGTPRIEMTPHPVQRLDAVTTPVLQGASPTPRPSGFDQDVLAWAGRTVPDGKGKDVTSGRPHKVNVYQDEGHPTVNRAKVDLDRDEKWDEKWTFAPDGITREIAPADDEVYTRTLRWSGQEWIDPSAPAPSPSAPEPTSAAAPTDRPVDAIALRYRGQSISGDKLKDVTKGQPFKVNVYQDAGQSTVNRLKIDLDRDDKWDEKWTFEADKTVREVAPADDEAYSERWIRSDAGWARE